MTLPTIAERTAAATAFAAKQQREAEEAAAAATKKAAEDAAAWEAKIVKLVAQAEGDVRRTLEYGLANFCYVRIEETRGRGWSPENMMLAEAAIRRLPHDAEYIYSLEIEDAGYDHVFRDEGGYETGRQWTPREFVTIKITWPQVRIA